MPLLYLFLDLPPRYLRISLICSSSFVCSSKHIYLIRKHSTKGKEINIASLESDDSSSDADLDRRHRSTMWDATTLYSAQLHLVQFSENNQRDEENKKIIDEEDVTLISKKIVEVLTWTMLRIACRWIVSKYYQISRRMRMMIMMNATDVVGNEGNTSKYAYGEDITNKTKMDIT